MTPELLTLDQLTDAMRQLTPPQHAAAMGALAHAHQTGDLFALLEVLAALAAEQRAQDSTP
jgi:hypothetical protein